MFLKWGNYIFTPTRAFLLEIITTVVNTTSRPIGYNTKPPITPFFLASSEFWGGRDRNPPPLFRAGGAEKILTFLTFCHLFLTFWAISKISDPDFGVSLIETPPPFF